MLTPTKEKKEQNPNQHHSAENSDPNLPLPKTPSFSKPIKLSPKHKKTHLLSPPLPKERKFIVAAAAKKNKKDLKGVDPKKRQELAYVSLRASQEDFFKKDRSSEGREAEDDREGIIPEPGSRRVKELVDAFESLLSVSGGEPGTHKRGAEGRWAVSGMRQPEMKAESEPDFETDSRLCSSLDGREERLSWGSRRSSGGSKRSRRNSSDCLRVSWNKKLKVTCQQPFKLRTEQRGRLKEENFLQKVKEMLVEEEKKRIPIAQGLPWTTDEPECLVKPPVKESTEPIDLVLHSDVRAVERAEFDHHIAERLSIAEQMRLERERQQKLEEEEEIRRLRRELVPKAQPMPYFDRPFVPKRSARPRTVPKEPRFHVRTMRSSCQCFACGQMKRGRIRCKPTSWNSL